MTRTHFFFIALVVAWFLTPETSQAREIVHEVKKGQNLGMIAKRYHTTANAIRQQNELSPKRHIYPGQKLRIEESAEHRKWLQFYAEKLDPKRHQAEKKRADDKRAAKKRAENKRAEDSAKKRADDKRAAKKRAENKRSAKRRSAKRMSKRTSDKRKRTARVKRRSRYESNSRHPSKYRKAPRKRGLITLVRFERKFQGTLVDDNGVLDEKAATQVDRFMRSWRTGEKHEIDRRLLRLLTQVSDHFGGRKIMVVSGFRPVREKQFTKNSRHNHGQAVDFRIVGVPLNEVFDYCNGFQNVGCGSYPNSGFIHMDVREHKTHWTDYSRPGQAPIYAHKMDKKKRRAARSGDDKSSKRSKSKAKAGKDDASTDGHDDDKNDDGDKADDKQASSSEGSAAEGKDGGDESKPVARKKPAESKKRDTRKPGGSSKKSR